MDSTRSIERTGNKDNPTLKWKSKYESFVSGVYNVANGEIYASNAATSFVDNNLIFQWRYPK